MDEFLVSCGLAYLTVGILWVMRNHGSRLAAYDRAEWKEKRQYWKFVVIPVVVVLLWPLAAWMVLKIRKAIRSGEFDRLMKEAMEEERKKKNGHKGTE